MSERTMRSSTLAAATAWLAMAGAVARAQDAKGLDEVLRQVEAAQVELVRGRPDAFKSLWSQRDDVTLVGGLGGEIARGREAVERRLDWVSTQYSEGSRTHEEVSRVVGQDLAFVVQRETIRFRIPGEGRQVEQTLRATMVFRREDGTWRIVHRHADAQTVRAPIAPIAPARPCAIAAAEPGIEGWFAAWELASREILELPDAPAPELVLFDDTCVYTTSAATAGGAAGTDGPALFGVALPWRALPHGGALTLPDGSTMPVQLATFANSTPETGPFFVMAAPSYWVEKGHGQEPGLTGVFLHEFAHTRQVRGLLGVIGPIDATWPYEKELDDDAVQTHFEDDPAYVAVYLEERELLYRAADAPTDGEARALATEALAKMRARQARWFTGDRAVFATLDGVFLALEGVGQWTAYAWLAHPEGGRLERDAAITRMLGRRHRWTQDEGLALFLVIDRLLPGWPALAFADPAPDALELLERAVRATPE